MMVGVLLLDHVLNEIGLLFEDVPVPGVGVIVVLCLLELLGGLFHGDLDLSLHLKVLLELVLVLFDLALVVGLLAFGDLQGQGLVLVLESRLREDGSLEFVLDVLDLLAQLWTVVLGDLLLELLHVGLHL